VNTCKNRLNSRAHRQKRRTVALDNPGTDGGSAAYEVKNGSPGPAARLERKERAAMVQKAIDTLDADRKSVVILRDIQGLAYEEIAAVTGFALGTVKSKLARARAELREKLRSVIDNGL
jgi:RNA polymerase sigma-70 factor (ECF subfamily)